MSARSIPVVELLLVVTLLMIVGRQVSSNPDARRLYDDLLRKSQYNRLIRPAQNSSSSLLILISLKLSQIIDVDEKNEIITTNVWLNQVIGLLFLIITLNESGSASVRSTEWTDYSLVWDPAEYGGVNMLYVPAESIWIPDIVLYNNADGDYIITLMTKVTISYNGSVKWEPPAIYKSQCEINVQYFPFDEQMCRMKFGSWTYSGLLIDVRHKWNKGKEFDLIEPAIQLNEFYKSVEWDLMNVSARKNSVKYPCCGDEPYPDVSFYITIRRKTLYLIINLIIPCVSINMLTFLAFYLPCDCGEKISVCISIMLSLSIFQLLLMDLVPGTSIVIPMIGKYLLLTCILVSMSAILSVVVLNLNHSHSNRFHLYNICSQVLSKSCPILAVWTPFMYDTKEYKHAFPILTPADPRDLGYVVKLTFAAFCELTRNVVKQRSLENITMPKWVRLIFVDTLPQFLFIKRPPDKRFDLETNIDFSSAHSELIPFGNPYKTESKSSHPNLDSLKDMYGANEDKMAGFNKSTICEACARWKMRKFPPNVHKAIDGLAFVANHVKSADNSRREQDDWKYVARVFDRIALCLYLAICFIGGMTILLNAPTLYDGKQPLPDGI